MQQFEITAPQQPLAHQSNLDNMLLMGSVPLKYNICRLTCLLTPIIPKIVLAYWPHPYLQRHLYLEGALYEVSNSRLCSLLLGNLS